MADSRRASSRQLKRVEYVVQAQSRLIQFMSTILISLLLTYLIKDDTLNTAQVYVLFLLFFSMGLWITEAIPPFAVGIMIVGFLVFFLGQPSMDAFDIDVAKFVNTWSDSVIWILLGGFFLAEGMRKTGLDMSMFQLVTSRFKSDPYQLLLALMLTTALISMVMSNTATTAMMFAALMPLIKKLGRDNGFSKCLLLGIPGAASVGGMGTIIGSPPNAIAVDMINRMPQFDQDIDFFDWLVFGFPIALILVVLFWWMLTRRYKPEVNLDFSMLSIPKKKRPSSFQYVVSWDAQKVMWSVLAVTMLLWLTDGLHPVPMAAVSGIPIVALTMTNIIGAEDVRTLPWDTLMLVTGGLSLGLAIQETGLMDFFLSHLQNSAMHTTFLVAAFALIAVTASNVMSNTAAAAILIPAAGLWETTYPLLLPVVIGLSASCALFLPVSTPPNAIAYSTGLVEQKEFRPGGLLVGLFGPMLIAVWVYLVLIWKF